LVQNTIKAGEANLALLRKNLEDEKETVASEAKILQALRGELEERAEALRGREELLKAEHKSQWIKEAKYEIQAEIDEIQNKAMDDLWRSLESEAEKRLITAIQRRTATLATQATTVTVALPNEEMKARLIGRVGRNIKAFEQVTGTDLIIDDTPECVTISSFDPKRRELAKLTLMNLMIDGRIHPARIEELHKKSVEILDESLEETGAEAAQRSKVAGLLPEVLRTLGELRFRASYGQNVLEHSVEVAELAGMIGASLGLETSRLRKAALLHDIGKALPTEWGEAHALAGMKFLAHHGEKDSEILNAVGGHHGEIPSEGCLNPLVIAADQLSASRPGARRENLALITERQETLEALARGFRGVKEAYSLQAGRELRVFVVPEEIDDAGVSRLAQQLVRAIRGLKEYPGPVRVTVFRETRVTEATG
jgi:ribonuclease Y